MLLSPSLPLAYSQNPSALYTHNPPYLRLQPRYCESADEYVGELSSQPSDREALADAGTH